MKLIRLLFWVIFIFACGKAPEGEKIPDSVREILPIGAPANDCHPGTSFEKRVIGTSWSRYLDIEFNCGDDGNWKVSIIRFRQATMNETDVILQGLRALQKEEVKG